MQEQPSLEHHGVKGMRWGVRRIEDAAQVSTRTKVARTFIRKTSGEYETAAAIAGVAALGVAYVHSPTARAVMRVPAKATVHYMSDKEHRRKVAKVLMKAGVLYSKYS